MIRRSLAAGIVPAELDKSEANPRGRSANEARLRYAFRAELTSSVASSTLMLHLRQ